MYFTVFLDIHAAFDTISPTHIKQTLEEKGIDNLVTEWYYEYISHRNIIATIN